MWFTGGCTITTVVEGQKAVDSVESQVTNGRGDVMLKAAISHLLDQGVTDIDLDLGEVKRIDSSAIAEPVPAYAKSANAGGHLNLRRLPPEVQEMLDTVNKFDFPDFPGGLAY